VSAILDASVVVKWFVEDSLSEAAIAARDKWRSPAAPSLLMVEVANAFRRYVVRGDIELGLALDNLDLISRIVRMVDHRPFLEEATSLAVRRNHSVQDCLYVVLALRRGLPLVTADQKLARKFADLNGLTLRLIGGEP